MTQFGVNYPVHHSSFVQTIMYYITGVHDPLYSARLFYLDMQ